MVSQIAKSPLPYLALAGAYLIWGGNYVVAKVTLTEIPPMSLAFLRFTLACLFLLPFLFTHPEKIRIRLDDLPKLILIGLTMVTFNIALFYLGLSRTTAISTSSLDLMIPLLSVLGGWWFLREKIYWINLIGILLGLAGAVTIIGVPLLFVSAPSGDSLLGNLLIILSDVSFVIGAILSKSISRRYSSLTLTAIIFLIGMLTFIFPAIQEYSGNPAWVDKISVLGLLGLLYISLLSSVCAYFLFTWALQKIDLPKATLFQYFGPAIAATLAVPILGERISFSFIIGTCLVVLGVYWGTFGKLEHHHLHHSHSRD